jgi:AcrR family transcriptional regulator
VTGARCLLTAAVNPGMIGQMNERSFADALAGAGASRGSRSREAILQAAFDLFLDQGYHGTSMRQIAREARLSPAAIYNHFWGKETLFTTLLTMRLPDRALAGALAQAQGRGAEELVRDALRKMDGAMTDQYDNLRLVLIEMLEFQGRHVRGMAAEILPEALNFATRLQQSGRRVRGLDPLMIVRALSGLFMSYALTVAFFGNVPALGSKTDDLAVLGDIFLYGVLEGRGDPARAVRRGRRAER